MISVLRSKERQHHCCNDRELLVKTRGGPPYSWHHEFYCPECNKVFHQETMFGPMIEGPQPPGRCR